MNSIFSDRFAPGRLALEESLFHTANGYLGVRAAFEEGYAEDLPSPAPGGFRGCYLNAFFETHDIRHPEKLFGFPEEGERLVNVTDPQTIRLFADGEPMLLRPPNVDGFRRELDMDAGTARRSFAWTSSAGKRLEIVVRRLASLAVPELYAVEYTVRAVDGPVLVELESTLEGGVSNGHDEADPRLASEAFAPLSVVRAEARLDGSLRVDARTARTGFLVAAACAHRALPAQPWETAKWKTGASVRAAWTLRAGEEAILEKFAAFSDSRRRGEGAGQHAEEAAAEAGRRGFAAAARDHLEALAELRRGAAAEIGGDPEADEGLRYAVHQLLQAAPRDGVGGIPAKALSGEGYEGHYFWDTEIYMAPFYVYTRPASARLLLEYRHSILDGARERARAMGQTRGAAYPWRTISGRECSAYYPSGAAQYHINADIAYAVAKYYEATLDAAFMEDFGAEILFETARTWMEIGHYLGGEFRIEAVTGPDEYTCLVDNNYYTNAMARFNLLAAAAENARLAREAPSRLSALARKLDLEDGEAAAWSKAARAMYLGRDAELDVSPQDDGFMAKAAWDFGAEPRDGGPLLLRYHHLHLIRKRVCKQADVVLAHLLLPGIAAPSTERASFAYYEALTTHDSSLSYAAFAAMAARLGDAGKAYRYFRKTVRLDLDDEHGNAKDGLHAACMGGAWMAAVMGFGGFRPDGDGVAFGPIIPEAWTSLRFRVTYRGSLVEARIGRERCEFELVGGPPLAVRCRGETAVAAASSPAVFRGAEGPPRPCGLRGGGV